MSVEAMVNANWWQEFGYSASPYLTEALSSEMGDKLLVGRDVEVDALIAQLASGLRVPLLIGANGVGKTSIANVAAYRMGPGKAGGGARYFVIKPLQIRHPFSLEQFEQNLYLEIARALVAESDFLTRKGVKRADIDSLRDALFRPSFKETGFGVSTAIIGISANQSTTPTGSLETVLQLNVLEWLHQCFSGPDGGGVICIIDSLELGGTSTEVRRVLETLRDPFFGAPGLLWVLCGTPAAVEGALSSSVLDGWLAPRWIESLDERLAPELVRRRLEYFGEAGALSPVDEMDFRYIYAVVHSRLRTALALCEDFAWFLHNYPERQATSPDWSKKLRVWLKQLAANSNDRAGDVPDESWDLFDLITDLGADIRSSNPRVVNMDNARQLDETAGPLVQNGLLQRSEMDAGSFMLSVTKAGWLVNFRRNNYEIAGTPGAS
jgi:hypothetical protein